MICLLTKDSNILDILRVEEGVVVRSLKELQFYIIHKKIEKIIIFNFSQDKEKIQEVIDFLYNLKFNGSILIGDSIFKEILNYLPEKFFVKIGKYKFYPIKNLLKYKDYSISERIFDAFMAGSLILIFMPIFLIVPILIKLSSPGPIFYINERIGKNGKRFKFLKFRSLKVATEVDEKERAKKVIELIKKGEKKVTKIVDEKRLTFIGKFLRKTAIDELPQFFNVLKGDMGIVGPRPCLPYEYEAYTEWQKRRFDVIPGCTGIWQIYGKGKVGFDEMVAMDMFYPYNRNLLLKLSLMWETFKIMIKRKGDD